MSVRRITNFLLAFVALLVLVGATLYLALSKSGRPIRSGSEPLDALAAPVTVRFDRWGVPAIAATSGLDAAAALGWLHANDRLFQMELTRRAAVGRLAELFGERAAAHDRRVVRLGFRSALRRLTASVPPPTRALLEAYANGVNAWIEARGSDLPPEFRLLRHRPEPWSAHDSLGVLFVMARTLSPVVEPPEEDLFRFLRAFGAERARELAGDRAAVVFDEIVALAAEVRAEPTRIDKNAEGDGLGSNNWAVAPARAASGHALLANDPHLDLRLPNVWYQARIAAPDYDALGMTLPGAPGVVLGRGSNLAWACTNLYLDDVDLFFERVDPTGARVLRGDEWIAMTVERETVRIGDREETIEVRRTDRGAFLETDRELGLPSRSVAWTGWESGDQIAAFIGLAGAGSIAEVPAIIAGYNFPAQNLLVAAASGAIAWTPLGRGPRRIGWDGRFAAPAWRTDIGWQGLIPAAENPLLVNPESGALATANSRLPIARPSWFGEDFETPFRLDRILERLVATADWTPESLLALQSDAVSLWAKKLVANLGDGHVGDAAKAAATLAGWNGDMATAGPAALFALFEREIQRRIFEDEAHRANLPRFGTRKRLAALLDGELSASFWDDVTTAESEERDTIVAAALESAWRQAVARWGDQVSRWPYGAIHKLTLNHALGSLPLIGRRFERGPFEVAGSASTILAFGGPWKGDAMDVTYGPSMRFVTDAADPESSLAILPGGQSGHPWDPHYADQLPLFLSGAARPTAWGREAIERATLSTLRLEPAAPRND